MFLNKRTDKRCARYCVDSSYVKNRFARIGLGKNHTDRGRKALKLSVICDDSGTIVGACCHPGNRPDVVLLEDTIRSAFVRLDSLELFADRGYDSRKNRSICKENGLKDRIFRRKTKTVRRTNAKRIVVEHTFAWLDQYRRLLLCYEQTPSIYLTLCILAIATTPNAQSSTIGTTTPLSTSGGDAEHSFTMNPTPLRSPLHRKTRNCRV